MGWRRATIWASSEFRGSAVELLLGLAESARYFRGDDGRFLARLPGGSRHEVVALKSSVHQIVTLGGVLRDRLRSNSKLSRVSPCSARL